MTMRTDVQPTGHGWGIRQIIGVLGFLAVGNAYIQRFCLSLAITKMVSNKHLEMKDPNACPMPIDVANKTLQAGEFDWNEGQQGYILSAFFWGYVITQLPGGILAERYGAKHVLGTGMLVSTLCTFLTPIISEKTGVIGLVILRVIMGFGQGPLYPSLNVLMSHWAPQVERGRMGSLVFAGAQLGNLISMVISGLIVSAWGWRATFYIFGGAGLVWYILWFVVFSSSPSNHRWISEHERDYIENNSGRTAFADLPPVPWKPILTSVPLWGLIIAQIGHDWGLFTIITDLPKYMSSVLHFETRENGLISGLPYFVMWAIAIISGWIVDWMVGPKHMDVTNIRKLFITIASVGPAIGIVAAGYAGCDKTLTSVLFICGMGLMGAFIPSLKVNALDLSPNYAGTLMALVGGIGAAAGILTPYLVGEIAPNSYRYEWLAVFWLTFAILIITNIVYVFIGSAAVQWWNNPENVRRYSEQKSGNN